MSIGELALLVNDNFEKPLNRQIQDMIGLLADTSKIYTTIGLGSKSIWGSKIPSISSLDAPFSDWLMVESPNNIIMNCDGTIYFNTSINLSFGGNPNEDSSSVYRLLLYKNDTEISRTQGTTQIPEDVATSATMSTGDKLITVKKGDIISTKIYFGSQNSYYQPMINYVNFGTAQIKAIPAIIGTNLITKG